MNGHSVLIAYHRLGIVCRMANRQFAAVVIASSSGGYIRRGVWLD